MDAVQQSYIRLGPARPESPILLSVPHAGRQYPPALIDALQVCEAALRPLEDRYVDHVARAARGAETLLIAERPRAWIDLNRSEQERDPKIDLGASPFGPPVPSAKLRGGLGLVPRRVGRAVELWRRPFTDAEVRARIEKDHRPYHAALRAGLNAARARFGLAILLDIHSMPSLDRPARIVLGDRFGRSAAPAFSDCLAQVATAHGIACAMNDPYPGGHILERHGNPARGIHAVQIEFDRALYLDAALDRPGPGARTTAMLLRAMIDAVAQAAGPAHVAAE